MSRTKHWRGDKAQRYLIPPLEPDVPGSEVRDLEASHRRPSSQKSQLEREGTGSGEPVGSDAKELDVTQPGMRHQQLAVSHLHLIPSRQFLAEIVAHEIGQPTVKAFGYDWPVAWR